MKIETAARHVTVFVNSNDQWHSGPLYAAIVQLCQEHGIAGATVTRCSEGYGAGGQLHTTRLLELTESVPVRIDIVDVAERIDPLLEPLATLVGEGLVVIAEVRVQRYLAAPRP